MSILSRQAIEAKLASGELKISPTPESEDFDSDSVDVHLGMKVYEWVKPNAGTTTTISIWKTPPDAFRYVDFARANLRDVPVDNSGIITLRPHTFYLADLREHTSLPNDVAMHVQGKSSLARLGVMIHLTAPHAHAGWNGLLTLEIYNLGPFNIELMPGMIIGQLTFWTVEGLSSNRPHMRQFDNQANARGPAA